MIKKLIAAALFIAALAIASPATRAQNIPGGTCAAHQYANAYNFQVGWNCGQPAFADLSGQATLAQLPTLSANTVLGALTNTTPSGLALPGCTDSGGNHLNWTNGTGFSCGTSSSSGAASAFYFHKNGTVQGPMFTGSYQRVTWSTTKFNTTGNALSSNTWTAPTTGTVHLDAEIFWTAHAASSGNPTFDLKFIKNSAGICNGSDVFAAIGTPIVGFPTTALALGGGDDNATAGDVYEVCAFGTSDDAGNDLQIDGNQAHVHWSGHYVH